MYFLIRGLKYLMKKKGRTILLGVILIVISNFVLAGLLVKNASEKTQESTRIKIGADVTYTFNMEAFLDNVRRGMVEGGAFRQIRNQMNTGLTISKEYTENGGPTYSNFMKLTDSSYVSSYDLSVSVNMASNNDLTVYSAGSSVQADDQAGQGTFTLDFALALEPMDFTNGTSELVIGRMPDKDEIDSGAHVILIEENIAESNDLSIGDSISLSPLSEAYADAALEYMIIGIYRTTQETDQRLIGIGGAGLLPQNKFYAPFTSINSIGITGSELGDLVLSANVIRLKDPLFIEDFIDEAGTKIDLVYGRLDANDALYERLVGPIENLGKASGLIVVIILVSGALIIGLITALTVNERKEEIGILLAIGERKRNIVFQFVFEVLLIAIISFSLSIFTGSYIGQKISDSVLDSDLIVQEEPRIGIPAAGQRQGRFFDNIFGAGTEPEIEQEASIDIDLDPDTLLELFGLGLALSVISTVIPALYVMRFNPKQILTNKLS